MLKNQKVRQFYVWVGFVTTITIIALFISLVFYVHYLYYTLVV